VTQRRLLFKEMCEIVNIYNNFNIYLL